MKILNFTLLLLITFNTYLYSEDNSNKRIQSVEKFLEAKQLEMKTSITADQIEEFDFQTYKITIKRLNQIRNSKSKISFNNNILMRNHLIKRGVTYRLNLANNSTNRCDFFDCEGQEACGFEDWVGDGICDDGQYGMNRPNIFSAPVNSQNFSIGVVA